MNMTGRTQDLKPQDVLILLKLLALSGKPWTVRSLVPELFLSYGEIHAGLKRAEAARLFDSRRRRPVRRALEEFLVHGVKYAYSPDRGGLTRGLPTGYAAPPLRNIIVQSDEPPPVWPDPLGERQGYAFSPLYRSAPQAASVDPKLYELLALVDAIRDGRARETELAVRELKARLAGAGDQTG